MHQIKNGTKGPPHALSTQKGLPREVAGQGHRLTFNQKKPWFKSWYCHFGLRQVISQLRGWKGT